MRWFALMLLAPITNFPHDARWSILLLMMHAAETLQQSCLVVAQGRRHNGYAPSPQLSVKCMFNGRAVYRAERACFAVDETGYLILNDRQPYEIQINSPTRVESFIIYFPRGWSQEVLRGLATPQDKLLDDPVGQEGPVHFFERFSNHDDVVSPQLAALRQAHKKGPLPDLVVEETLRDLLARMLQAQRETFREIDHLTALRVSTRKELWRRLNRARDFIRARFDTPLTLSQMSAIACLSPFHFLRAFKAAFRCTPHELVAACRIERAKFLLECTEMPVTQICLDVGFESLGTFSSWFRRLVGVSPREWRGKKAGLKKYSKAPFRYFLHHEGRQLEF
jgi:AraC-like DNA-binding protein